MADPADERAAYNEAMQRAEAAAGISRDAAGNEQHASEETPAATPELPEAVPVQASDQPLTPEPVTETDTSEQQPAEPTPAVEPQSIAEQLAAAQARLEEKDSFIGRQSSEVGELRTMVDELRTRLDAQASEPPPPQQVVITQDMIDTNPGYAVQVAYAQSNEQALGVAFEAWKLEDPFTASTWLGERRLEQQQKAFDAKLAEQQRQIESVATPLAQSAEQSAEQGAWNQAFTAAVQSRPDFLQHAERLLQAVEADTEHPLRPALGSDNPNVRAKALVTLYDLDTDHLRVELDKEAAEAAAEAAAARQGAQVVSQATVGQPGVEKTSEEQESDAYLNRMGSKPSLEKGWTGRAS